MEELERHHRIGGLQLLQRLQPGTQTLIDELIDGLSARIEAGSDDQEQIVLAARFGHSRERQDESETCSSELGKRRGWR